MRIPTIHLNGTSNGQGGTVKSIQQLAQAALDAQDACNLSGVAHSLSRAVSDLWVIARLSKQGTQWVNTHPIVQLYVDKLASLSGGDSSAAYSECERLSVTEEEVAHEG